MQMLSASSQRALASCRLSQIRCLQARRFSNRSRSPRPPRTRQNRKPTGSHRFRRLGRPLTPLSADAQPDHHHGISRTANIDVAVGGASPVLQRHQPHVRYVGVAQREVNASLSLFISLILDSECRICLCSITIRCCRPLPAPLTSAINFYIGLSAHSTLTMALAALSLVLHTKARTVQHLSSLH